MGRGKARDAPALYKEGSQDCHPRMHKGAIAGSGGRAAIDKVRNILLLERDDHTCTGGHMPTIKHFIKSHCWRRKPLQLAQTFDLSSRALLRVLKA